MYNVYHIFIWIVRAVTRKGKFILDKLKTQQLRTAFVISEGVVRLGILDKERLGKEYELLSPKLKSLIKTLALRLKETTKKASLLAAG
jgi:hypothetical protein